MGVSSRASLLSTILVLALTLASGIVWWAKGLYKGAFTPLWSAGFAGYLVAFALVQVWSWFLVLVIHRRAMIASSGTRHRKVLVLAVVLLLANLLYWFTPVAGAPIVLLVSLAGLPLLFRPRHSQAI